MNTPPAPNAMTVDDLHAGFVAPPRNAAPMIRWWWFGPSVQREELDRELAEMTAAGFGGVEVAFVYPLAPATTEFLSDSFLDDLRFTAERARDHGLRFDLTLGSGWSFGGPHIPPNLAARRLRWDRREIGGGPVDISALPTWPDDEFIAAYVGDGSVQEQPEFYEQLPAEHRMIKIPDRAGPRHVLLAYAERTGQNVKRAAVGAEGPVLDHYSAAATAAHLGAVGDRLLDAVPAELVGSVFCDSLEVYGADWTPNLPQEFVRRCGYELLPQMYRLIVDGPESARVRADYHRTLSRLYEDNFVTVIQRWAAARGVPFRLQGYGTPPATIASFRFADLFEGEGWGWQEITQARWASSAAHLYGRPVVSAEVWTWVHSPSFRATPLDLMGEAHEHFLSGINQLVGHGWPYSPAEAPGVGWIFYAAGAINERNPWWPAMPKLNAYLTRLSWLLRQGEPAADVAVYVSNEDLFATMGSGAGGSLDAWREARRRIDPAVPAGIRIAGLDYDLIDEEALSTTRADRYPVVVVPNTGRVSDTTRGWLEQVQAVGGSVIMIGSSVQLEGAIESTAVGFAGALTGVIGSDLGVSPAASDVGFVHRRFRDLDVYLLVNTGPERRAFRCASRSAGSGYEQWDASTGEVVRAGTGLADLDISLDPYQATVLVLTRAPADGRSRLHPTNVGRSTVRGLELGPWQVAFAGEEPEPVALPHVWEDDPIRRHFSGSARYEAVLQVDEVEADAQVWLDFGEMFTDVDAEVGSGGLVGPAFRALASGPIGEVAQVSVNGIDCGLLWAPPYTCELNPALRVGANTIVITVSNTAANALAADSEITRLAADSEQRYGRRFRLQDIDGAMSTVRSGLLRAPVIIVRD